MPDFWSHRYAATVAYEQSLANFAPFSKRAFKYYMLGAQGPDLFYYLNKTNLMTKRHYRHVGNRLHTQEVKQVMERMLSYLQKDSDPDLLAYTLGFYTHFQMDSHCHPYICAWGPDSKSHKVVEMALDALTLYTYQGALISKNRISRLHPKRNEITDTFYHFLNQVIPNVALMKKDLKHINRDFSALQWILLKDVVGKLPFKTAIANKLGYDLRGIRYTKDLAGIERQWDFSAYKTAFEKGIDASKVGITMLYHNKNNLEKQLEWIENTITTDYLGDPLL